MQREGRYELASDNTAGICPEALDALQRVNYGDAVSYGDDEWTKRLRIRVREIFETDCEAFLLLNGTAANSLALAQICESFEGIVCHQRAHIQTDECGAPEFFTRGSKLLLIDSANGKLDVAAVEDLVIRYRDFHSHRPRVISITQATELGGVYGPNEIAALSELARKRQLLLHVDGARFANAVAHLNCAPKDLTWKAGVDVICFGGTKNGVAAGEVVVFFNKELARDFEYRVKQGGQLVSKMRFFAAPWLALLENDVWLANARRANAGATKLAELLRSEAKIDILFPVQANAVFFRMPEQVMARVNESGWRFYKFIEPDIYRVMCAWSVEESVIEQFVNDVKSARQSQ